MFESLLAIRREVFVNEQNVDPALEYDSYDEPGAESAHFLLIYNGSPAGAARLIGYKNGYGKLQRMAVLKEFRCLGLGSALVGKAEETARSSGYAGIVLNAQYAVKDFYIKSGYRPVSDEIFFEAGIRHIQMIKDF